MMRWHKGLITKAKAEKETAAAKAKAEKAEKKAAKEIVTAKVNVELMMRW